MKIVKTDYKGNRRYSVVQLGDTFECICTIDGQGSRAFPTREYKSIPGATRRGEQFLNAK